MDERRRLGNMGENAVADYLRDRGYCLLEQQFSCQFGEIDLIVYSPEGALCFVEVKTRSSRGVVRALESVTPTKQRRLRSAALSYLVQAQMDCLCRFDVAEVYPDSSQGWEQPRINYIIDAFY